MQSNTQRRQINKNFPNEFFVQKSQDQRLAKIKKLIMKQPVKSDQIIANQLNEVQRQQLQTPTFREKGNSQMQVPKLDIVKICNNYDFQKTFNLTKKVPSSIQCSPYGGNQASDKKKDELSLNDLQAGIQRFPQQVFSAPLISTRESQVPCGQNLYQKILFQNMNMKRLYPKQLPPLKPIQHKIVKSSKSQQILQRRISEPFDAQDGNENLNYTFSNRDQVQIVKNQMLSYKKKNSKSALRLRVPSSVKENESNILVDNYKSIRRQLL